MGDHRYSRRALASLRAFDEWLRARNPAAADAVSAEIDRLCGLLAEFPDMGRSIPGTALRYHVTRKYRYRVIYRKAPGGVEIVDVLHPRQQE